MNVPVFVAAYMSTRNRGGGRASDVNEALSVVFSILMWILFLELVILVLIVSFSPQKDGFSAGLQTSSFEIQRHHQKQ